MIEGADNNLTAGARSVAGGAPRAPQRAPDAGFADALQNSIDELTALQQETNRAVDELLRGQSKDINRVLSAMEKSDAAFKMLLAVRGDLNKSYGQDAT
jgi:flagellar hook-basal body complex protein FliE